MPIYPSKLPRNRHAGKPLTVRRSCSFVIFCGNHPNFLLETRSDRETVPRSCLSFILSCLVQTCASPATRGEVYCGHAGRPGGGELRKRPRSGHSGLRYLCSRKGIKRSVFQGVAIHANDRRGSRTQWTCERCHTDGGSYGHAIL